MNGVGIVGQIDQFPDFHRIEDRALGNGHVPVHAIEEHLVGVASEVVYLVQGELTSLDSSGFRDFWDWPQDSRERDRIGGAFFGYAELHHVENVVFDYDLLAVMAREVNNDVQAFSGTKNELLQLKRRRQEALITTDLDEGLPIGQGQSIETRV